MCKENENSELSIVTEIGVFGELDITDPTKKKVKRNSQELDSIIEETIKNNNDNLKNV